MNQNIPVEARALLEEAAALLDSDSFHLWKGAAFRITQYLAGVPVAPYGYCPICSKPGMTREQVPGGKDRCQAGHIYASLMARPAPVVEDYVAPGAADDMAQVMKQSS